MRECLGGKLNNRSHLNRIIYHVEFTHLIAGHVSSVKDIAHDAHYYNFSNDDDRYNQHSLLDV
ncbi:hypothetical protein Leryth_000459 [Lithospermum erythrorhizon]|nr:hypothetical protein Leryth_000459 [Lithospermum erythrorhizon]